MLSLDATLCGAGSPSDITITPVGYKQISAQNVSVNLTTSLPNSGLLVVSAAGRDSGPISVTDSQSNTYQLAKQGNNSSGAASGAIYYLDLSTTTGLNSGSSIIVNWSTSNTSYFRSAQLYYVTGVSQFDVAFDAQEGYTSPITASGPAPACANAMAHIGVIATGVNTIRTFTGSDGYIRANQYGMSFSSGAHFYKSDYPGSNISLTVVPNSSSGNFYLVLAVFK